MPCTYTYNGIEYSKDLLIEQLATDLFKTLNTPDSPLRSIATKSKSSTIVADTALMLNQRYIDAKNMLQAINNSNESKEEKLKKTAYYKNIMEKTNEARKELLAEASNKQLDWILEKGLADVAIVEAIYKSDKVTFNELQFANEVVETWSNLKKVLGIESIYEIPDEATRDKVNDVLNKYRELEERTRQIAVRLLQNSGIKDFKIIDTTKLTEYTRELSTAGIPITNKLAYIIKEINLKINKEHIKNHSKIDSMFDKIKDNPIYKSMGWDLFLKTQKDKSGAEVLALTTKYSQTFWDKLRHANLVRKTDIQKAAGDPAKIKQAWKDYNSWNEENTVPFNAVPFIELAEHTDAERDAEVSRMKSLGFNQSEINSIIHESVVFHEKFLANRDEYESRINLEAIKSPELIPMGLSAEAYIEEKMEEWDNLNNPLKYMKQKFTKGEIVTAYGGARYTYLIAAKEVKGKPSGYYDENFAKIVADPALYEFYDWFTKFMKENLGWLPEEETEDLQSNFIPVIADRVVKEYGFTALKESVKGLGDWFMKTLTANNYDQKVEKAAFSKKERRSFKARFINESISIEDRSKDLVLISKLFSDMALVYKHKNTVRAEIDTINDFLQDTEGSYKKNKNTGELEAISKDATSIKSLADYTVRKSFYGIKSEDPLWKSDQLFYDWKELITLGLWQSDKAKQAKKLSDRIIEINKNLEDESLTQEEIEKLELELESLKSEFYKLGGRKFSLTAAIDSSINVTRKTSLGFAPFSAIRNLVVGKINNKLHARGGRDFTSKELLWANKVIIESSGKYWSGGKFETKMTKIIFGLMSDAQLAEGEDGIYLKTMVDKQTTLDKLREMAPSAYTWLSSGDYHFKAEMLMAAMKFEKVKTSKGDISFIDVLTEDREYNEAEYGPWDKDANEGLSFEDFYNKKILKYKQLANKLHGATGSDVAILGKDTAVGRLLFLFKSWLPETVGVRFDPRHKDALLDRDEEGYYRTFLRKAREKKLGIFKIMIQTAFNKENGITDPMELANFKKAVKEMQIILTIWMAYLLAKAMAPDDDKDKKIYNLLVLRQLYDLRRDMTYYSNINSIGELTKEVVPIVRTAQNWEQAFQAATYYGLGVKNDEGEEMYDAERTALKITKVLPVFSNINRVNFYMKGLSDGGARY
jgi:hypothetical protein